MTSSFSIQLRQIQQAMPGTVLPSKKMLLVILSGIISFVFCIIVLFVLFYLDHSVSQPKELVAATKLPVLGTLSKVKSAGIDLKDIWQSASANKDENRLRNELRSVRFEVDHEMGDNSKLLAVTSLKKEEGKTFLSISLASAYAMTEKKILLIDGNFANPSITAIVKPTHYLEDYLTGKEAAPGATPHVIHLLGNRGGDASLMEITGKDTLVAKLEELKNRFDVIIVETAALSEQDRAKEWLQLSDKIVGVFETGRTVTLEKKESVAYLAAQGNIFAGWVLNKALK
jgi:Mrp family chromosome partitioning ATPase